jgi:uracil-DNA glycosylase
MDERPAPTLSESIAAAQAWWREAGVDYAYAEEAQPWLAESEAQSPRPAHSPKSAPAPAAPTPPPTLGGDKSGWPSDLDAFRTWWMAESSLDEGGVFPRVAPHGPSAAPLMAVVPMPEETDGETLLSGLQGRLIASFLQAGGLDPDQAYWASALPRHTPLPDWPRLAAQGLGEILLHHVALARPKRLIVFGRGVLPLVGHDPAQVSPAVSELAIQGGSVPMLMTYSPARLLTSPRLRAGLWRRWLDWTEGNGT